MSQKIKVFFCEDDQILVEVYKNKFSQAGFDVQTSSDPEMFIEKIKKFHPDLIFYDILYDGYSAFEVLNKITTDAELKHIPVVALTNLRSEEDRKKVLACGIKEYLAKAETSLERMIAIVEDILQLQLCPNCHEKVRLSEGKCERCGG